MAGRIRSVSPDICVSETMARISPECERTFVRLWTHCDDEGRCKDNVRLIKAALYPLHDHVTLEKLDAELDELAAEGLLVRYEADGERYLQVRSWAEFQHPQRPTPSKIPAPAGHSASPPRDVREPSASPPVGIASGVGGEKEKEGSKRGGASAPAARRRQESPETTERKQIAREMTDRYWEWIQQTTGAPPAEKHPAIAALLADLLKHYTRDQISKALRGLRVYTPPKPITKQTLLNEVQGLNGRARGGGAPTPPAPGTRRDLTVEELERLEAMGPDERAAVDARWRRGERLIFPEELERA